MEPALRTLVTVRVSQINWCAFCVDINSGTALKRGIDEEKLLLLSSFEDGDLYSEREKAALGVEPQGFCAPDRISAPPVA